MGKRTILSILIALCVSVGVAAQERFSRNIDSQTFIPKGQWVTGVNNFLSSRGLTGIHIRLM